MASITHVPQLFSVEYIFLEVNTALYGKKKERKNLNSNNHLGDTKFNEYKRVLTDNSNTNQFEYYIIQQLFKGVWVIQIPALGPHIRPSAPGPHKSFNKLNLLLVNIQSL